MSISYNKNMYSKEKRLTLVQAKKAFREGATIVCFTEDQRERRRTAGVIPQPGDDLDAIHSSKAAYRCKPVWYAIKPNGN